MAGGEQRSCSGDGAAAEFYGSVALASGGRKEKGAGDRGEGMAWEPEPASRPGGLEASRGASNAGVRPPRGRRRVERGASAHAGEKEKGSRPGRSLGRKGSGVGTAAPAPSLFF